MDPTRLVGWIWPKDLILGALAVAAIIAPLFMVFGCGVVIDILSYGSAL